METIYLMKGSILFLVTLISLTNAVAELQKSWPPRPKYTEKAKMARYLCHNVQWGVVSAISPEFGYVPFGTVQSFADGTQRWSTGIPYFYIADISDTYKNIVYNNTVSLTMSEDEGPYCRREKLDPEEPLCARLTLTGKMVPVPAGKERKFAKMALFSRHPAMKNWPTSHGWAFFKLELKAVCVLDFYGGASHVPVKEYLDANFTMNDLYVVDNL